jgi:predicted hotdog family 3-hydroxylacyl-ACP dehydratase
MLIDPEKIQALLPHGPRMQLLDEVIRFDAETLVARTNRHHDFKNPLRRSCGMLPVSSGIEFAGQATALHGALIDQSERSSPRQGFLVMARDVYWRVERLDDLGSELEINVRLISRNEQSAMYQFDLHTQAQSNLIEGRMAVYFQGDEL